ncbi:MAG TPA: hypothetical protein VGS28_04220 [Candidatus Saccharimonadales bacterium]|nr:hypothetical protein [Candidatus Saccharimonadales bacterium]
MGPLQKLEKQLAVPLDTKAPYKMSEDARKSLAGALWWLALILGLIQLIAAWSLWRLGQDVNTVVTVVNNLANAYGATTTVSLGVFFYISLAAVVIDGVILLLAVAPLKALKKAGWNLVYYSLLLNVVYGIIRVFSNVGGGFGDLVAAVVGSVVAAYFIFQVRSDFMTKGSASASAPKPAAPASKV